MKPVSSFVLRSVTVASLVFALATGANAKSEEQTALDAFVIACVKTAPDHKNARAVLQREGFTEDRHGSWSKDWLKIDPGKQAGGASPNPYCIGLMNRLDPVKTGDALAKRIQAEGFKILSATRKGRKTSISTMKDGKAISFYIAPRLVGTTDGGTMMSIFPTKK